MGLGVGSVVRESPARHQTPEALDMPESDFGCPVLQRIHEVVRFQSGMAEIHAGTAVDGAVFPLTRTAVAAAKLESSSRFKLRASFCAVGRFDGYGNPRAAIDGVSRPR